MSIPFAQELAQLVGHWAPAFAAAIAIFSSMLLCAFLCGKKKKVSLSCELLYRITLPSLAEGNGAVQVREQDAEQLLDAHRPRHRQHQEHQVSCQFCSGVHEEDAFRSPAVAEQQGTATADPSKTPQVSLSHCTLCLTDVSVPEIGTRQRGRPEATARLGH